MTIFKHLFGCSEREKEGFVKLKELEFKCNKCGKQISVMDSNSLDEKDKKIFEELMEN